MQACFHLRHVQWSLLRWSARPGHLHVHSQIEIRADVRCGRRCDLGLASELLRLVQIRHLIKTERNRLFADTAYTSSGDLGDINTYTLSNLLENTAYHFSVTAVNSAG